MFRARHTSGLDALIQRHEPSLWEQFLSRPIIFLAKTLYETASVRFSPDKRETATEDLASPVSVVCISDTHNNQPEVPDGNILLHAGDLTQSGSRTEIQKTIDWLNTLPHEHKVVIAGNHDTYLDVSFENSESCPSPHQNIDWGTVTYLQNESVTIKRGDRHIKIYGSPFSPRQGNWGFQYPRTENVWKEVIPSEVDILMTHTPPKAHLDLNNGCDMLLEELWRLEKKPKLHVFGHVHAAHGKQTALFDSFQSQYETIMKGSASVVALFAFVYEYLKSRLFTGRAPGSGTIMVNPAIIGGIRDELRRDPTVVYI